MSLLRHHLPQLLFAPVLVALVLAAARADSGPITEPTRTEMREWVDEMKEAPRGPFQRIRWFCADGTILPPVPYACREHGGGVQHGEWHGRTRAIRDQGYLIATLLADLDAEAFTGPDARLDELRQILLERFLIQNDDGWIFRQARYYRGAIQVEDEHAAARTLLLAMVDDERWREPPRHVLLREAARLLPLDSEQPATATVRQLAMEIAEQDPGFHDLRVKLHGMPDAGDARRVREYAAVRGVPGLAESYRRLASELDTLYAPQTAIDRLEQIVAESASPQLRMTLTGAVTRFNATPGLEARLQLAAGFARQWRILFQEKGDLNAPERLRLLQAGLAMEHEVFAVANRLLEASTDADRLTHLRRLRDLAKALFGAGLMSERQWQALDGRIAVLTEMDAPDVETYLGELRYFALVTGWAQRALEFHFGPTVELWSDITPLGMHLVPDRLRGSALLPWTRTLDVLIQDAQTLAGVPGEVFGEDAGAGVRALNPGLARGVLRAPHATPEGFHRDGIYLLPSTMPELPPVAGIITRGEGSSLSHVQLLARNLGVPNLVVDDETASRLQARVGERIVMAVSPRGGVRIAADGPHWDTVFGRESPAADRMVRADLDKLDLGSTALIDLRELHAHDSGRRVGPKAANLGELRRHYPEQVNAGVVIPFGVFRALLDRPIRPGGPSAYQWLRQEYARLHAIEDPARRMAETRHMLEYLRSWIATTDPGEAFRSRLREALEDTFGSADTRGVFVRSDTNVEDLPGFTGAGLNLTVANVSGFEAIVRAVQRVWASPFTERAYAWRQDLMSQPEHVYPSVLLLETFPAEKSGVLVTADVDTGDRAWLSIAVNEGIGGAVDGQAAEELRVHRDTGEVRLLAQASAPMRAEPAPGGGLRRVPASGRDTVLAPTEIEHLRRLAADLEQRVPMPEVHGIPAAADIEFGFRDGHLALFQIRPFVESPRARRSLYLTGMDHGASHGTDHPVDLRRPPLSVTMEQATP